MLVSFQWMLNTNGKGLKALAFATVPDISPQHFLKTHFMLRK